MYYVMRASAPSLHRDSLILLHWLYFVNDNGGSSPLPISLILWNDVNKVKQL